uniref:Uncharacterized protein n=1 Tax=Triticum urartu TaxID=4572 RepID=A0A8R7V9H6_TRIUA
PPSSSAFASRRSCSRSVAASRSCYPEQRRCFQKLLPATCSSPPRRAPTTSSPPSRCRFCVLSHEQCRVYYIGVSSTSSLQPRASSSSSPPSSAALTTLTARGSTSSTSSRQSSVS